MIAVQNQKFVQITPPAAIIDNASATTTAIDTLGWSHCLILVQLGAMDIAMTALKVQESEASDMTGAADITGATFASSLPSATADNGIYAFYINCTGKRMRYLDLVATLGDGAAGTFIAAMAILSRGQDVPFDATTRGLAGEVVV